MSPETIQFYRERCDYSKEGNVSVLIDVDSLSELLDAIDPPKAAEQASMTRQKALEWLLETLAIAVEPQAPPADTVRVRIAVAQELNNHLHVYAITESFNEDKAREWADRWSDSKIIARAIVVADIPKLRTPEVAGRVEEVGG